MSGKLKIILAFCLSVAILIVTGIYSYRSTREYKSASGWVTHTQLVISDIESILLNIQGVENAQRGYVITGEDQYLMPYQKDVASVEVSYQELSELIKDNRSQDALLDSIHELINLKIAWADKVIAVRQKNGFEAAQALVTTDIGLKQMEQIHDSVTGFINHEKQLLAGRMVQENNNFIRTVSIIVSSITLAVIIVLITMYFFIMDYNSRIRSEKKVLESEARTKKFLDSLPLGIFIVRPGRIPYYENDKFKTFFQRENNPENALQSYIAGTDIKYPSDKFPITRALRGEKNIFVEDLEVEKNGLRIPIRVNATHVTNADNEIEYAISVVEDISDVKETEKKLIEAKKMAEESVILKEAFLANMSHEIRTPMNAIIGFTDLLLKKDLQFDEKEYVQIIKSAGENLMRIINDILDVSKIDSGMMTFEEHPINIRELFNSINTMLAEKANTKKLSLTFDTDSNVPAIVSGDPTRLTQIIINIVGNAVKFTKQGAVTVFAKKIKEEGDIYRIAFSIKDTGIGIPEDKLQSVFERFRQAESHTTRNYGGTGLGLSIAKQLVELQGGTIDTKSKVDVGSVFTFTLSFKKTTETTTGDRKKNQEINVAELSKLYILLAEDNPVNIKFMQSLFSEYNIRMDIAENGKQAVEKIKQREYDLVLMDMEMPEMNGYEATVVIRTELKNNIPIIAMTAHAMAGEKEKCLQLGMNDYVSKPVKTDLLFEKMLSVTDAKRKSRESARAGEKIINLDFLVKSMRGKNEAILETIDVFLTQMKKDLADLQDAISKEDLKTTGKYAHRMRSTVSLMGITTMENVLEEMETLGTQESDPEKIKQLYETLKALSLRARDEIQAEKSVYTI